ncbi:AAA family ATPase [Sphaerospermopsis sp. LEGE 08334]|jgi:predicted ATP-binding protein involved in virulence|uniref:AAA family ATPase n=1 Tax=Sphaerospermopsis sp. LEGE 08334 TaxID=1828651 RepID=UPI00187ED187|nr:AAA family ATPase [Sphaerospermopsis sp. LEGE 08334]MBE9058901.1 AAA family ATPase [Sphaerospermopsis sp. LEGE 08334]
MKIRQLELQNFRCFEHKVFDFSDHFNVFIGDNATGKTAILKALSTGASILLLFVPEIPTRDYQIDQDDIRHIKYYKGEIPTFERQFPFKVSCQGMINNYESSWHIQMLSDNELKFSPNNAEYIVKQLVEQVTKGEDIILPLIAYYGTNRLWMPSTENDIKTIKPGSRLQGYIDCLNPVSNLRALLEWLKTMEIASLQRGQVINLLDTVKTAIISCIENCHEVKYDILEDQLMVTFDNKTELPLRMLSDGFRTILTMVADIAYRAAVLNPQLGSEAAKLTPGIVLIDEIDLHLHPKWQRRVVKDLKRTFPNIQFFATTHSPLIIQSLKEGELIDLNNPDLLPAAEYENKYMEHITKNVMLVDNVNRNERYQQMMETAERYYKMLENANNSSPEELEKLKSELDELIEPYSDDVAYHAFLKMKRLAKLGE